MKKETKTKKPISQVQAQILWRWLLKHGQL